MCYDLRSTLRERQMSEQNDQIECAYVEMKGAVTRLLMIIEHRSERNFDLARIVAERALAKYHALKHQPIDA